MTAARFKVQKERIRYDKAENPASGGLALGQLLSIQSSLKFNGSSLYCHIPSQNLLPAEHTFLSSRSSFGSVHTLQIRRTEQGFTQCNYYPEYGIRNSRDEK